MPSAKCPIKNSWNFYNTLFVSLSKQNVTTKLLPVQLLKLLVYY